MISDFPWNDLLELIDERRVIPIVGEQLLKVEYEGSAIPLYRYVAEQLAERLRLPPAELPAQFTLNDVVCCHRGKRSDPDEIYRKVRPIFREALFDPPEALLQLARIDHFDLFVSLTFDSLLSDAIDRVRFGGEHRTLELVYNPAGKDDGEGQDDLPIGWRKTLQPVVFHLLGKLSASPDYVVSDEDLLEFCYSLQFRDRRPQRLFDELSNNHLLFLGCRFSDWLARFFMRMSKGKPLSKKRSWEVLVDQNMASDSGLVLFLSHFSSNTRLLTISADQFVAELARRWEARHPSGPEPVVAPGEGPAAPADMEPGAIFISYASDDLAAAQSLHDGLERASLDAWLDKRRLEAGDHWDTKIRRYIHQCSLFIPLISQTTEQRWEGYFRREWHWAAERSQGIAEGVPFILPVVIDTTPVSPETRVPQEFLKPQWTPLEGGRITPAFADKLRQLVRDYWKRQRG